MDPDLSLLEISGEDDSLLLQIPNDDASMLSNHNNNNGNNNSYFMCSPLQIHGSKRSVHPPPLGPPIVEGKVGGENAEKPCSSLLTDSINKENINANKSEVPKLSMEPQQMKRRKKGGGYNLRKSLAWDRAFFTEKGVLDPLELSMISGGLSNVGEEMLPCIPEEGRESLSGVLDCTRDSADLQSLEENLFKELSTSSLNEDRKRGCRLLPKHCSTVRDNVSPAAAKAKVLSAHEINRSGSKRSGCPRPAVSSSLKRPANLNTTKAATKASKVSKIPVPKPNSSVLSRTTKGTSLSASDSKRNQIAQPGAAVNVQRKIQPKASSGNTRSAQNNPKAGPANKSLTVGTSVRQARRNVVSSASEKHRSTNLQSPPVTTATKGLEVIPDPLGPSTSHKPNSHDCGGNKIAVSLPQNACYAGGNMHHAQLQTAKPSGLRMPTPSLGFFGQPKVSSLRSALQRSSQPQKFESNIPNFRKPGAINHIHNLRPPTHPGKIPNVVNDVRTIGGNMEVLCSSLECSVPSTVNPASHNSQDEKTKSFLKMNNRQKVEVKEPCQATKYQQQVHSIIDDVEQQVLERAEPYKTEMISQSEDMELQKIDDKFPLLGAPCGQLDKSDDNKKVADVCLGNRDSCGTELENHPSISCLSPAVQDKGVSGTNDLIDHQTVQDQPYNLEIKTGGAFSGSNSGAASYNTWSTLKAKVPCQAIQNQQQPHSIIDDVEQQVLERAEPYKTEMISHSEDIELQKIDDKFPLQGAPCAQLGKSDDNKVADVCLRNRDSSGTELENHPSISCLSPAVQDEGVSGTNDLIDHQAVEDQPYNLALKNRGAFSGSNSGAASYNTWSTLKANDDWLSSAHKVKEQSGEQAELMKHFTCKDDKISTESQRVWANDAILLEDSGAPEESQKFSCMADVSPKVQDCIETELEKSHGQSPYMYMEQAKDDGNKDDKTSRKSPVGDVQAESLDCDMSDATGKSSLSPSPVDNQLLVVVDEVNKRFGEEVELRQSIESVILEASGACESKSKSSSTLCLIPAAMQACGHDMAKTVECQYVEDVPSISVDGKPVVEDYNSSIDTQFRHDMELHGQVISMELDTMGENHIPVNGCPKSGDFSPSELENPHLACHLSPAVQVEGGSEIDDVIQREDMEEKKCTLSTKNPHSISEFQTVDDSGCSYQDTSILHIDLLSGKHSTNEHSVERAKLILHCPCEADTISYEENKSPETYPRSLLFAKSQSFGGSMKLNSMTMADYSKVKGSGGNGLEGPHGLSQHKHVDQATKEVGVNDMFKESQVVQSPDGSILVDYCNSNASILGVKNQCQMVVDDGNDQSGHPELPNSILVVERVSQQDDLLLANTTSGELNKENDFSVLERSDVYGSESKSAKLFSHVTPASQDNGLDADQEAECLHMDDAVTGSVYIEPLVENPEHYRDAKFWHENGLSAQASSLETEKLSTDQISGAVATCKYSKSFCSLNEESGLSVISVQASESGNVLKNGSLPGEAETSISQICEMQQDLDQVTYATEDKDATVQLRKPEDDEKEALVVKPPPLAVPFSDEWLAAFEGAGEEILTMKSGAVQNSPPDKSPHEPGPWSPVKKKNNQGIGPFDCTKHTNIPSSSSQ